MGIAGTIVPQIVAQYKTQLVAEELAKAISLARAQADGFGLPFSIQLPSGEVICDGSSVKVSGVEGNITTEGVARLKLGVEPFQADGGILVIYPGGKVRVEG